MSSALKSNLIASGFFDGPERAANALHDWFDEREINAFDDSNDPNDTDPSWPDRVFSKIDFETMILQEHDGAMKVSSHFKEVIFLHVRVTSFARAEFVGQVAIDPFFVKM